MAEETTGGASGGTDIIIPLSVETGNADQTLEGLEKHVDSLRSKLSRLTENTQEYIDVQSRLTGATDKLASATERLNGIFSNVASAGVKMATDTQVINDGMTAMSNNIVTTSDVLDAINANFKESGESAKEAAQGTERYTGTLEKLEKGLEGADVAMGELKATKKDLQKAIDAESVGSDKWKELTKALGQVEGAIKEVKQEQKDLTTGVKASDNSIAGMRLRVAELKKEWANADFGSEEFEKLTADLAEANTELTKMEQAVGIGGRNVGNYKSALDDISGSLDNMIPGLGSATKGIGALTKQALAFIATPIGAIIAAITVALKALHSAFTRSAEGQEKFNVIMGYISGAVTVLLDLIADLGEWLIKVFTEPGAAFKDFKKYVLDPATIGIRTIANAAMGAGYAIAGIFDKDAREKSKQYFAQIKQDWQELGDTASGMFEAVKGKVKEAADEAQAMADIAKRENELKREQIEMQGRLGELNRKINEAREKSMQVDQYSNAERLAFMEESKRLTEEVGRIETDWAQRSYEIIRDKNALSKSTLEDLEKEAEAQKAVDDRRAKTIMDSRRMVSQMSSLRKSEADKAKADQEKANADYIKAMQDRIKAAEDVAKAEAAGDAEALESFRGILAEREAELEKASQKRLTLSELEKRELELQESQHQKNLSEIVAAAASKALDEQLKAREAANKALADAENVAIAQRNAARAQAEAELLSAQTSENEAAVTAARERLAAIDAAELEHQQAVRDREAENIRLRMEIIRAGLENEAIVGAERAALQQQLADAENALLLNTASTAEAAAKRELKAEQDLAASKKRINEDTAKNKKKTQDTINNLVQAGLNVAGEGTVAAKALGVAQATISTYTGAAEALKNPWPLNLAAMAAVITAGLMQVKSILSVKVPGVGGSSGGGVSMPSVTPIASYTAPIVETHTNMTSDEVDEINAAQKVYVVESDITDAQNKVKVAVSESTF